jgi:hypothetical protein
MTGEERNARTSTDGEEYELHAVDVRLYNLDEPRDAKLVAWRLSCFEAAGIDELTASSLALHRDIDRVKVEAMVKDGATSADLRAILL